MLYKFSQFELSWLWKFEHLFHVRCSLTRADGNVNFNSFFKAKCFAVFLDSKTRLRTDVSPRLAGETPMYSRQRKLSRWCVWERRWLAWPSPQTPPPPGQCGLYSSCLRRCRNTSAVGTQTLKLRLVAAAAKARRRRLTWCLVLSNTNQRGFQPFSSAPRLCRIPS